MPGISKRGSMMLTQKCGVTERFSLNTTQTTPILAIAVVARPSRVRQVRAPVRLTSGVGMVADHRVGGMDVAAGDRRR